MLFFFADDSRQLKPSRPGMGPLVAIGGVGVADTELRSLQEEIERLCAKTPDSLQASPSLADTARDTYPPAIAALVLARNARHLALTPEPEASVARWRGAIERACVEGLNADAADWLYALRGVKVQNGLLVGDLNELHRHAQALRAAGSGTLLPVPYGARERALANLRDEKWPDALEALRRYLWRSTIGADWAGEMDAHERLGDLFAVTDRSAEAVRHYVYAGQRKKLETLAGSLRDEPVRLPTDLLTPRPWERAAAFSFASASADLLVDDDARAWCSATFREIVEHPQPAAMFAPDPWVAAFNAFGQLALVSTEEQAQRFLEIGQDLVPRRPNTYRFTDEGHVLSPHRDCTCPSWPPRTGSRPDRPSAPRGSADGRARLAARSRPVPGRPDEDHGGVGRSRQQGQPLRRTRADRRRGRHDANPALGASSTRGSSRATRSQARRPDLRHRPVADRGAYTVLPEEDRVRFARGLLEFANDVQETGRNRYEALAALQAIARLVPDDVRDELFEQILSFAEGHHETAGGDEFYAGADDPLRASGSRLDERRWHRPD